MNRLAMVARISKSKLNKINNKFYATGEKVIIPMEDCIESVSYYELNKETPIGTFSMVSMDKKSCISLSKSAIKQYLLYHFIPTATKWLRTGVSFRDIANLCNVSIPTAKANHSLLEKAGFVSSRPNGYGKIDIIITEEHKNHLPKKEGGCGYVTLSIDMLKHLISFECVNDLKAEIKKLLWVDASKGATGKRIKFNRNNLINILPDYIRKSKVLTNKVLTNKSTLFTFAKGALDTSKHESKKKLRDRLKNQVKDNVDMLFDLTGASFSSHYSDLLRKLNTNSYEYLFEREDLIRNIDNSKAFIINDISELGLQFGLHKVINALQYMFSNYCFTDEEINIGINEIHNPSGFIRSLITNTIKNNGSLSSIEI